MGGWTSKGRGARGPAIGLSRLPSPWRSLRDYRVEPFREGARVSRYGLETQQAGSCDGPGGCRAGVIDTPFSARCE